MIKVVNIYKSFKDRLILNNINFEVNKGETLVIIGGSGSGKSTLLKLLIGLLRPEQGQIFIDGKEISKLKEEELDKVRLNMGMVFQYSALFDSMSVGDNVGFGLQEHSKLSAKEIKEIVEEKLNLVGLSGFANYMPNELSGGMRQRVGIAMAIIFRPELLLADEPTSALDVTTQAQIVKELMEIPRSCGTAMIVVTHNIGVAAYMSDKIMVMKQGKVVEYGKAEDIINSPQAEYTKTLLASVPQIGGQRYV
jgi:phospholipid/cholesterol/gamma-HCH transport system ATP-binding protein